MLIEKSSCCSVSVETVPHRKTVKMFCYSTSIAEYGDDVPVDMFIV